MLAIQILHGPLTEAAPSIVWVPEKSGVYHVVVGTTGYKAFGVGSVSISQDDLAFTDLDGLTVATRKLVHFAMGVPVTFAVAASDDDTSVKIRTTLDPEWPRRY